MALVAARSDRWGVQLQAERKVTWVELTTSLSTPHGHSRNVHVSRGENVIGFLRSAAACTSLDRAQLRFEADAERMAK
ncbi:hypothetical protein [Streptomyces sp. NPDC048612]|uniref:hypothetical protein n=1 Tax=Streptomyces sp. NPDC048612 TaxID=3365579 RepID=UPI003716C76C